MHSSPVMSRWIRSPKHSTYGPVSRTTSKSRAFPSATTWAWAWWSRLRWTSTTIRSDLRSLWTASRTSWVMHHEDFTFEIPFGIRAMDGFSHHHPFAFTLPLEFYDVGLHSVIIGDGDSDFARRRFRGSDGHVGTSLTEAGSVASLERHHCPGCHACCPAARISRRSRDPQPRAEGGRATPRVTTHAHTGHGVG